MLGALSACERAEHVEMLGRDNRLDDVDASLTELIGEVDALMPEILVLQGGDANVTENA